MSPSAVSTELHDWCPKCNPWLIAVSVMLATFMEVLDTSIAAVALPYIAGSVSATTDEATWVLTSYLVANAVVLPASTWFSLRFGRKRFLLLCIVIFTAASFACGSSTSLAMILIARAIQGAGGGALQPISQAILMESFPPAKRGSAMAVFALGVVVAPVLGPTLGGWLTEQYTWRWAFYINIPIGILAIFMISRFVEDPPYIKNAHPRTFDSIGLGLLAVWVGTLQIILDKGQEDDWFGAVWIRWAAAVLLISFVAFLIRQLRARQPIVDLSIFKNRNFAMGCLLIGLFGAVIYGVVTILPLFYQTIMGYSAWAAGLAVAPRGVGAILIMPVVAILTSRLDNRWLILAGFVLFGITSLEFGSLTLEISQWSLFWPIVLSGCASGMVFVPLSTVAMGTLSNEQMGNAAGLYNLIRNVGGSVGISMVDTLVARHEQVHRAEMLHHLTFQNPAFRHAFRQTQAIMAAHAGPVAARARTLAVINRALESQSALWSYVDDFRYIALACFGCGVIVFFLKGVKGRKGAAPAH
ncbi:MAG: DHA2 family efflux MFS transporter permease subunit [Bryobacteraceae bacterium]